VRRDRTTRNILPSFLWRPSWRFRDAPERQGCLSNLAGGIDRRAQANLLDLIGQADPSLAPEPAPLYAAACRSRRGDESWQLQTWAHALAVGQPLPTLPLWLTESFAVPLELEASYEETCSILRIP
jgi:hypothetical protein